MVPGKQNITVPTFIGTINFVDNRIDVILLPANEKKEFRNAIDNEIRKLKEMMAQGRCVSPDAIRNHIDFYNWILSHIDDPDWQKEPGEEIINQVELFSAVWCNPISLRKIEISKENIMYLS